MRFLNEYGIVKVMKSRGSGRADFITFIQKFRNDASGRRCFIYG